MVKNMRWLVLCLIVLPLLEIFVMIEVGTIIGAWATVAWVIAAAFAGVILIRMQGLITWRNVVAALARGQLPAAELIDAVVVLVAGVLLFIPGFISDAMAILCLLPPIRRWGVLWVLRHALDFRRRPPGGPSPPAKPRTIEGDYRRE